MFDFLKYFSSETKYGSGEGVESNYDFTLNKLDSRNLRISCCSKLSCLFFKVLIFINVLLMNLKRTMTATTMTATYALLRLLAPILLHVLFAQLLGVVIV